MPRYDITTSAGYGFGTFSKNLALEKYVEHVRFSRATTGARSGQDVKLLREGIVALEYFGKYSFAEQAEKQLDAFEAKLDK